MQQVKNLENIMYGILVTVIILIIVLLATQLAYGETTYTVTIQNGQLNIRDKPGRDGEVIGYLVDGDTVAVMETKSNWYHIDAPTESGEGWVSGDYLTLTDVPLGQYTNTSGGRVRIRKQPGGDTSSWLKDGATVEVQRWAELDGENWAATEKGYINGNCLEVKK